MFPPSPILPLSPPTFCALLHCAVLWGGGDVNMGIKKQFRRRFRCSSGLRACLVETRSDAGGGSKVVY